MGNNFTPPDIKPINRGKNNDVSKDKDTETTTTTESTKIGNDKLKTPVYNADQYTEIVKVSDMLNLKTSQVSESFKARIDAHLQLLEGKRAVAREKLGLEQRNFMQTMHNVFKLEIKDFILVTDYLVGLVKQRPEAFKRTTFGKYIPLVYDYYTRENIKRYEMYFEFVINIGNNIQHRDRLSKLLDLNLLCAHFDSPTATKINTYFTHLLYR